MIGFSLIPNLLFTICRLLNINSPSSPVIWAPLPLINWWIRYSNSNLKMTNLVIPLTSSNRSFSNSRCCTISGFISTSSNWDITSSTGTKCCWWNQAYKQSKIQLFMKPVCIFPLWTIHLSQSRQRSQNSLIVNLPKYNMSSVQYETLKLHFPLLQNSLTSIHS